jgi:hypothetical protein
MKTKYALIAALALGSVAFATEETSTRALAATPSTAAAESPQKLEKFMVTGSLATPADAPQKLDKFLVTGSLATPTDAPERLEKFMVTGSLATPADAPEKLEKFMVTGSMFQPAAKRPTPARLK